MLHCVKRLEPAVSGPTTDKPRGKDLSNRILHDFLNDRTEEDSKPKVTKEPNDTPDTRYGNYGKMAAQDNVIIYNYRPIICNYIDL